MHAPDTQMNTETRPYVVTGGSGYFGSLLVRLLVERGRKVRVFDLNDADDRPARVEFQRGDVRDLDACRQACAGAEAVFHCVAQVPLAKDSELFWSVNRDGTRNLLQAAFDSGVRKVVYTSSSAVFGVPSVYPITADTPPCPAEDYGAAKLAGETLCRESVEKGLDVSIIRPRTIMGHGRLGIMQFVFESVAQGRDVFVLGKGDNMFQFVHSDDLADACVRAAERPGFAVYNIGAENFGTMRATLEGLVAARGDRQPGPLAALRAGGRRHEAHEPPAGLAAGDLSLARLRQGRGLRRLPAESRIGLERSLVERRNVHPVVPVVSGEPQAHPGREGRVSAPLGRQGRRAEAVALDLNKTRAVGA